MEILYTPHAKKKATNYSLNSSLSLNEQEIKIWGTKNKISINNYNKKIAKHSTFSDKIRSF
jgi:hypothetical protein